MTHRQAHRFVIGTYLQKERLVQYEFCQAGARNGMFASRVYAYLSVYAWRCRNSHAVRCGVESIACSYGLDAEVKVRTFRTKQRMYVHIRLRTSLPWRFKYHVTLEQVWYSILP